MVMQYLLVLIQRDAGGIFSNALHSGVEALQPVSVEELIAIFRRSVIAFPEFPIGLNLSVEARFGAFDFVSVSRAFDPISPNFLERAIISRDMSQPEACFFSVIARIVIIIDRRELARLSVVGVVEIFKRLVDVFECFRREGSLELFSEAA